MRFRILVPLVLLGAIVSFPAESAAQSLEVGATAGTHQGAQVSVWITPRFEWMLRVAWQRVPSLQGAATYYRCQDRARADCPVRILINNSGWRRFSSSEFVYHFRLNERVRPFAGAGLGIASDLVHRTCEATGCEPEFPSGFFDNKREPTSQLFGSVGASTAVGEHAIVRAGLRFHNLIFEGASVEAGVSVGYRF